MDPTRLPKSGEILLVDPKYSDQTEPKDRPVLVISNEIFHYNLPYALCVGITTNIEPNPYLIPIPNRIIENGRLDSNSQVMCHKIALVKRNTVIKKLGDVTPDFYKTVMSKIMKDVIQQ